VVSCFYCHGAAAHGASGERRLPGPAQQGPPAAPHEDRGECSNCH
jgi:hypothetical protein